LEKRLFFGKTTPYGKLCSKRFHRDTNRRVVFKFREIWPMGNQSNRALLTRQKTTPKNVLKSAELLPKA